MMRLFRIIRNTLISLAVLYGALFIFTKVVHYPEPIASIKLGLAPASKTPTLMPWHVIDPSDKPIALPVASEKMPAEIMYKGTSLAFNEFLKQTDTNAFLVIRNGVMTYEWYEDGVTQSTQLPSYSVAKTMTSIMIGQLINQGKIKESDKFVDYFPNLKAGTSFDLVTIQQLLDMQAGVGVSDNYPSGPSGWGVAIAQMYATTDLDWFLKNNRKMAFEPGSKSEYMSVDTQMLGMIIKKVTGKRVSDYFSKNVWQAVGAKYPATWNVDRIGGTEKTFCCFNASAIDYGRIGMLFLNGGYAGPTKVIDNNWLKRLSTPVTTLDRNWGYGAQVWHPYPNTSLALGLHGQFIFINPATRTVIVKLSDNPTDSDHESDTAKALLEISNLKN
ncbi:penicillin-binding protein [Candidatus Nanopelagicus limnes]|uniref:Penicillin-binding protein n=1 Tax=Candidatus Nanopelagicus limnae TaxID=1884634 RepID=A0A249JYJ8_9ACTN|nr:serine hydrolase [Candidatus Nanopelagicus limnes]ASY09604.1 penicillin-binding protein [Candidatus Nanopelagicus limnes]